jgi:hypothetical protein
VRQNGRASIRRLVRLDLSKPLAAAEMPCQVLGTTSSYCARSHREHRLCYLSSFEHKGALLVRESAIPPVPHAEPSRRAPPTALTEAVPTDMCRPSRASARAYDPRGARSNVSGAMGATHERF